MRQVIGAVLGAYLVLTSVYGTVYLSCLFVPREVEALLWYVTVDRHSALTMTLAAVFGAAVGIMDARRVVL